ncbi:hypothetical protein ABBQ38_002711 [Trebouxia sp. C0009 RCD-2024]
MLLPRPSLLALFGFVGTILFFTLARLDLSRVPTNASYLELRHSLSSPVSSDEKGIPGRELLAFIGVQTGFTTSTDAKYNYTARRQALRSTWFPDSQEGLDRLETDTNMVMRFIIGQTSDQAQEADLEAEASQYGGFMRLHLQEQYNSLTNKTVAFLRAVASQYSPRYIVKADDDVYLRVDRLPYAIKQWTAFKSDYIGCMKTGQIMTSPEWRWYEPQHAVLGSKQYFTHAWGSIYVLSGTAASSIAQMPSRMRYFANEDVTLGAWMLALDVNHFDDRRLCDPWCLSRT